MSNVEDYINSQDEKVQPLLQSIREIILSNAPEAVEKMAWQMPTYWQGKNLIHFAAHKKHIGLYPGAEAILHFTERLQGYKTSKGAIQLPISEPLDLALIADIVCWRKERAAGGL
ncbi:MAG: DUF1801 domain-containing protein [Coriobacteriia bacterium]|nr:DUF1801 domain-containing protein [Coriobacteriia bacterium]